MILYRLADRLHKTVEEIGNLSVTEVKGWLAYFSIVNEER